MPSSPTVPTRWCHWLLFNPAALSTVRRVFADPGPGPAARGRTAKVTRPLLVMYSTRSFADEVPLSESPMPMMRPPVVLEVRTHASTVTSSEVSILLTSRMREVEEFVNDAAVFDSLVIAPAAPKEAPASRTPASDPSEGAAVAE